MNPGEAGKALLSRTRAAGFRRVMCKKEAKEIMRDCKGERWGTIFPLSPLGWKPHYMLWWLPELLL